MLTVIIPTFNEELNIHATLSSLLAQDPSLEIIVSDGGSTDSTCEIVKTFSSVKLINSKPGRAVQMNTAAGVAVGGILCFLHADSSLPADFVSSISETFNNPKTKAAFFRFKTDSSKMRYRLMEFVVRLRSEVLKIPYGDQGITVRREVFEDLGGYEEVPAMEDLYLVRKLRKRGGFVAIKSGLITSVRKYEERGYVKTVLGHWGMVVRDWGRKE